MDPIERQRLEVACRLLGKSLVVELRKIEESHRIAFRQANDAYKSLRDEAIQKATAKIDATLVEERSEVVALEDRWTEAKRDVIAATVAESTKSGYKRGDEVWPVGTKVQYESGASYRRKTIFGVIEVCTPQTVFPENVGRYSQPPIGDFFVRICTKDGTPGKRISESVYDWKLAK